MLADTGGNTNKRLLDDIKNTATEVSVVLLFHFLLFQLRFPSQNQLLFPIVLVIELTPQVSHSAKLDVFAITITFYRLKN